MMKGLLIVSGIVFFVACAPMRDYTTPVDEGRGLAIDFRKGFGGGANSDNGYYTINKGVYLVVGDTGDEVSLKIGSPEKITTMPDASQCWIYPEKKIKLYFSDNLLRSWQED